MTRPKILLFSGHMTDLPDRAIPRFPPHKEPQARAAIDASLDTWGIGPDDVCLSGGARGGDILCAEAALRRGAGIELWLPMQIAPFLDASVRVGPDDPARWEARFHALVGKAAQVDILDATGTDAETNVFAENNLRMMARAKTLSEAADLHVLLLWDGQAGDGPGGTAHMAAEARAAQAALDIIAPQDL